MKLPIPIIWLFVLLAVVQLAVPANMIWGRERVLKSGTPFHFKTEPIDPNDPFRGKYITLNYEIEEYAINDPDSWTRDQEIYVQLTKDSLGFAKIQSVLLQPPAEGSDYVTAQVNYVEDYDDSKKIWITYPFDRYYMEESKAYEAEITAREAQRDTSRTAYAVVHVKEGEAVLADVMIDGVSIQEIVKKSLAE